MPIAIAAPSASPILRATSNARKTWKNSSAPPPRSNIAGMIAEPIQGVGGFITPPKEYFQIVSEIVRKYGGIFISDEVQTGWGRTGNKWFGIEQWGVTPDVMTSAKGLGNGMPIGLTVARPEVAEAWKGVHISTFGGNPITNTAAKAVIDLIEEENLAANAADTGAYLRAKLEELQKKYPVIGDVRGMGLMQGLELVEDPPPKLPLRNTPSSDGRRSRTSAFSSAAAASTATSSASRRLSTSKSPTSTNSSNVSICAFRSLN